MQNYSSSVHYKPLILYLLIALTYFVQPSLQICGKNCITCSPQDTCTKCYNNYALITNSCSKISDIFCDSSSETGKCTTACSIGYAIVTNQCLRCIPKFCQQCDPNNLSKCLLCSPGYSLNATTNDCNETCAVANCSICSGDKATCSLCKPGFRLSQNKCLACSTNCSSCPVDSATCSVCAPGFWLKTGVCTACGKGCLKCQDAAKCQECNQVEGFFMDKTETCQGRAQRALIGLVGLLGLMGVVFGG